MSISVVRSGVREFSIGSDHDTLGNVYCDIKCNIQKYLIYVSLGVKKVWKSKNGPLTSA